MCRQPALEDAECLWCSDAGWQTVPDARSSDEERPVTERRDDHGVTRADVDAERSRLLASMSATRHSSFARYGGAVPCRQRKMSTASLNSIHPRTGNQWRSQSSCVICSYFRAEQTSRAAALITDCSLSSWFLGGPASVALPYSPDVTAPAIIIIEFL